VFSSLKSQPGAVTDEILRPHGLGELAELLWCVHGGLPSSFDRLPPRLRNPDADDLNRLAARLHHITLFGREPGSNEASDHVNFEPMGDDKQLRRGAVWTAGEQL